MKPHPITLLIVVFCAGLAVWLFFWPIVECIYAMSIDPLFDPVHKFWLFCLGFFAFLGTVLGSAKVLIL